MGWVLLKNHSVGIHYRYDDYHMQFEVFNICELGSGDVELIDGFKTAPLDQWESFFWEISGGVKWDGCINWETNPECMAHGCGPSTVTQIHDTFAAIFNLAKRRFDLLDDPVPPMPDNAMEVGD